MIMEAFHGFTHKYDYSIVGHSGDSRLTDSRLENHTRENVKYILVRALASQNYHAII